MNIISNGSKWAGEAPDEEGKIIMHADWETAVAAGDDKLAQECRLEFALAGWQKPIDAAEFLASPDADICLGLGDWDHIENGLGEWDWAELAARLGWRKGAVRAIQA